jgi:hypothetical protein
VGMGGVAAPLLGILADANGLRSVFELLVVFPLAALALSLLLPVRRDPVRSGVAARHAHTTTTVASVTAAD